MCRLFSIRRIFIMHIYDIQKFKIGSLSIRAIGMESKKVGECGGHIVRHFSSFSGGIECPTCWRCSFICIHHHLHRIQMSISSDVRECASNTVKIKSSTSDVGSLCGESKIYSKVTAQSLYSQSGNPTFNVCIRRILDIEIDETSVRNAVTANIASVVS